MAQAKDALERLSEDPGARAMADARKKAEVYHMLADARSRQDAREEGRSSTLREMIVGFAELMSLPLTPERQRECPASAES